MHGSLTSLEHGSQFFFRSHRHCLINITKVSQINTHDHTVVLG
ncbi:LytTR family transcriptional regulator DNA-binding domain-containing protein, partial [Limosilactobacillus oris]